MILATYEKKNDKGEIILDYHVSDKHRQWGNPNKSIWTVSPDMEYGCFDFTYQNNWIEDNSAWGFLLDGSPHWVLLGKGIDGEELQIARFRKDPNAAEWHGYPCNYIANTYDVPPVSIMREWVEMNVITKAKMSKIQHGIPCNL